MLAACCSVAISLCSFWASLLNTITPPTRPCFTLWISAASGPLPPSFATIVWPTSRLRPTVGSLPPPPLEITTISRTITTASSGADHQILSATYPRRKVASACPAPRRWAPPTPLELACVAADAPSLCGVRAPPDPAALGGAHPVALSRSDPVPLPGAPALALPRARALALAGVGLPRRPRGRVGPLEEIVLVRRQSPFHLPSPFHLRFGRRSPDHEAGARRPAPAPR